MKKLLIILTVLIAFPSFLFAQAGIGRKPVTTTASLTDSSTEVEVDLSAVTRPIKQLQIKCRTSAAIRISFESGGTSGNYTTLPAGQTYFDDNLSWKGIVYLKADTGSSLTAEIQYWQ